MEVILGWAALALALIPAAMLVGNLRLYRRLPTRRRDAARPRVSVLIPARNEERNIGAAIDAVLANEDVDLEVVVMDDHSEDATVEFVEAYQARDGRVRLASAPRLPSGWCGKQHACFALSKTARHEVLVFLDADVRVSSDAIGRIVDHLEDQDLDLVSGFPRQQTGTFLERLLLPLIHFVLLGFLPIRRMRASTSPAYAAGCGQLMAARREAYETVGGHGAIRASRHDGITLPRAFRRAGLRTDLFDATDVASVRMYQNGPQVWEGLAKNATEGMASRAAIVPWTVILLGGQVLPFVLLLISAFAGNVSIPAAAAVLVTLAGRGALAVRFRQPWDSVLLHPLGVLVLVAIQWYALLRERTGNPVAWKGRTA